MNILKKIPFKYIFFILWHVILFAGLFLYLQYFQPAKLGDTISRFLDKNIALQSTIESYSLSFTPSLTITLNNTEFFDEAKNNTIFVKKLEANISWRSLFLLNPRIKRFSLDNPQFSITLPYEQKTNSNITQNNTTQTSKDIANTFYAYLKDFSIPHYFNSIKVDIKNAYGEIKIPHTKQHIIIDNANISLKAPDILDGYANISFEKIQFLQDTILLSSIANTKFEANDISYNPKYYSGNFKFISYLQFASLEQLTGVKPNPKYSIFPMPKPSEIRIESTFDIDIPDKSITINTKLANKSILPVNGYAIPLELRIPLKIEANFAKQGKTTYTFPTETAHNKAFRTAFLQENTLAKSAVDFDGFHINHIEINNAEIKADSDKAILSGKLYGLYPFNPLFAGTVKVEKFSLPRWIGPTRNMSTGLYNALNSISGNLDVFCTLKGVFSPKLHAKVLNHSVTGIAVTANFLKPDISFDLLLKQQKDSTIDVNNLFPEINGKNVQKVKLPPPAVDIEHKKTAKDDIKVDYHININIAEKAQIWKFLVEKASVLISPDKNDTPTIDVNIANLYGGTAKAKAYLYSTKKHQIEASINNVLLEAPVRNMLGYTASTGRLSANTNIALQGNDLHSILNSLEITANATIKNGAFHSKQEKIQDFESLQAKVAVKTIPYKVTKNNSPKTFALKGDWDINSITKDEIFKAKSHNTSINFSTETGLPVSRSPQNTAIRLEDRKTNEHILDGITDLGFNADEKSLTINNYKGMLRHSKLIANLTIKDMGKKFWNGSLYFQQLNLADYIKKETKKAKDTDKELPLSFITENVMDISLKADNLTFYDIKTSNFSGNLKIADNKISVNNLKTYINNGILQALLEGKVTQVANTKKYSIDTQYKMKAENIDMLAISKMRKHKTLMAGTGNIALQGTATLSKTSDLFKTMNATWNMNFVNGYFQSEREFNRQKTKSQSLIFEKENQQKQYGSKTTYTSLSASGNVVKGLVETHNILLQGNGLLAKGGGTINLQNDNINAYASATYLGIPEIPIKVTGTLEKPKIEVKVLNAVGHTLGNIGSGIFDVFNGFIIQPFKIFMQQ